MSRTGRRRAAAVLLFVLASALAATAPAFGAPAPHQAAAAASPTLRFGIPPIVITTPNDEFFPYGGALRTAVTYVEKAKVTAKVGGAQLMSYVRVCDKNIGTNGSAFQTCCPQPADISSCPAADIVQVPAVSQPVNAFWNQDVAVAWVASPHAQDTPTLDLYGRFPVSRVSLLAFGSIPVTATVHITQPIGAGGYLTPLTFRYLTLTGTLPKGLRVAGFPAPSPADQSFFDQYLTLSGPVDVRLSNVKIDNVVLDVGPNCHTGTPAALSFDGPRGWYPQAATADELFGKPGGFQPLSPITGRIAGNIAIPAFTGCRDLSRSLDPLITAMTSGTRNSVLLTLKRPLTECGGKTRCPPYPDPVAKQAASTAPGAAANVALSAAVVSHVTGSLQQMSPATRDAVLRALPAQLAAVVRSRI